MSFAFERVLYLVYSWNFFKNQNLTLFGTPLHVFFLIFTYLNKLLLPRLLQNFIYFLASFIIFLFPALIIHTYVFYLNPR